MKAKWSQSWREIGGLPNHFTPPLGLMYVARKSVAGVARHSQLYEARAINCRPFSMTPSDERERRNSSSRSLKSRRCLPRGLLPNQLARVPLRKCICGLRRATLDFDAIIEAQGMLKEYRALAAKNAPLAGQFEKVLALRAKNREVLSLAGLSAGQSPWLFLSFRSAG